MSEVHWIKIVTDIFDDEKIQLIEAMPDADAIIVCWFKLLCLAGKQNNSGVFMLNDRIAYTEEMLATIFRRPLNTVRMALSTFEAFGMVEIINGVITIPKWDKHQSLDAYEKKKERDRLYQASRRANQRLLAEKSSDKSSYVAVSEEDTDIDKKKSKKYIFTPPTLEEVKEYCRSRNSTVDADRFFEYYSAGNWKDAKGNTVKNWKQKLITWEKHNDNSGNVTQRRTANHDL